MKQEISDRLQTNTATSPTPHREPTLWKASRKAHVGILTLGGFPLLLLCSILVLFGGARNTPSWTSARSYWESLGPFDQCVTAAVISSASSGIIAWIALFLLLFLRHDIRWQIACWTACMLFGLLSAPTVLLWLLIVLLQLLGLPPAHAFSHHIACLILLTLAAPCVFKRIEFRHAALKVARERRDPLSPANI